MSHDLLDASINEMGGTVQKVVVSELKEHTFYVKVRIQGTNGVLEVDSRPGDAIALAVQAKGSIYAEDSVLEQASIKELSNYRPFSTLWSTSE